ncbi:T9SS type A sorting domain-containing protein [Winogradskyella bathintestinalis]|uniref:T9SS type A sorting domain-containing protein n=1 Tax=Winogradskyella bathintestinalis TaxID=3035208 RepID=A0ABT7ZVU0_9FLAO|nr:T9SS type A sorting domain-containing protein [Winogradskyella bathintestinalis]MDN3493094.1 T9SS type A sorting domain-containing protein [Winogradskyella bathintestinalis]
MKKITILLMLFMSIAAFSQVEILENFDDTPVSQVPMDWTTSAMGGNTEVFKANTQFTCGTTGSNVNANVFGGSNSTLITPNFTTVTNATDLTVSFDYNVFGLAFGFPPSAVVPPAGWGSIALEYTIDNGSTWINIITLNDTDFTFDSANTCSSSGVVNAGELAAGLDFQARFVVTNDSEDRLLFSIDNISITQEAITVPNCDATLTSPLADSNTAETDVVISWQTASGIAEGYTISVGTTSGGTDVVDAVTTTDTNYNLTGLTYNTEYFVNIVPYNSFGNATGCTEQSFTTRTPPLDGASCGAPIVVSSFPFLDLGGDTADFENNIDDSPCNSFYMNGNDVFYEITPTMDMSVNIEVNGIVPSTSNRASLHVIKDCPDVATECLAYEGSFSGDTRSALDIVLRTGNTYFVVLSSSNTNNTYEYDLIITQNSCINPTIDTLTPVSDCDNGEFFVDVDISYLGDASSLTLSDDVAGSADITNITETGIVSAGPYPSGTMVNFVLTNDDDDTCSYMDSAFYYCPPTNDDCSGAIDLTGSINADNSCNMVTAASNAGATDSTGDPSSCSGGSNDVWFSFVASSEIMILEYLNIDSAPGFPAGGVIQSTELLTGSCGDLTSVACFGSNYVTFTGLTTGTTYYVRNRTNFGSSQQNYDICLSNAASAPANDECSNAAVITASTDDMCTNQVSGSTTGATLSSGNSCNTEGYGDVWYVFNPTQNGVYEFTYERLSTTPTSSFAVYEGTCETLIEKTDGCTNSNQALTLDSALTYYVMVQSSQSGAGVDFNLCITQLPDAVANNDCSAPTVISESDSTGNNSISGNLENSYPSPENCNTSNNAIWYSFTPQYTGEYNFDFTRGDIGSVWYAVFDTDDCSNTNENYISGFNSCFNSSAKTGDLIAGNTYLISVHDDNPGNFDFFIYPDPALSVDSNSFESFKYYPNPVKNTLTVEARSSISQISIHNIMGQKVVETIPNNLTTSVDMNDLETGVYFVTVKINNALKTFRVIKE